ncbi:MAG: Ig-like domain-containing protein, partial [Cellulosilyticaceae bacterium]
MSKKFNRRIVAMVMATSLAATAVPAQVIQKSNQVDENIKGLEISEVTTGSMIQIEQTTGSAIQIVPVEEIEGNQVKNFSFEETTSSPSGSWASKEGAMEWTAAAWGNDSAKLPKIEVDTQEKISGNNSIRLESNDGKARGWIKQSIEVKPDTTYILEGYMKAENVNGRRFGVQVLEYVGNSTQAVDTNTDRTLKLRIEKDTQDWTKQKTEFKTSEQTTRIELIAYLGTHDVVVAGGTAWIDDLALTEKPAVAVEGVTLPEKVRVAEGDTVTLKPVFTPADATNQKVRWEIADEQVATVSASGMVKGVSEGITTIKVITEDGNHEATCEITVEKGGAVNLLENGSFEESMQVSNTTEKRIWKDGKAPKGWNSLWVPTEGTGLQFDLDQVEVSHGTQSVHINAPKQSRVCFMSTMAIDPNQAYRLSMNIKTQDVVGTGTYFRVQYLDKDNKKTQDALPSISGIKGTKDWDNYELVLKDIPANTTTLKIEVFFENATGQAWIDDARLVETYDFSLSQSNAKLLAGETLQLQAIFGADVPNKNVEWISSNEAVATVDANGLVTTLVPGAATITATTIDGNRATCSISVEDPALIPVYKELRQNWSDRMTINDIADKNNPDYVANMAALATDAQELWDTMNKYDSESEEIDTRQELWSKYTSNKVSADMTSTMANLRTMARAYASEGCSLYQNETLGKDILAALDWFYENRYNKEVKMYNNWWDWDIGVPQKLNDVLVLMYDQLSPEQLENQLGAINRFVPTPVSVPGGPNPLTGANLLDTAMVSAVSGMLEESNRRISEARDAVSDVLPYVTKGDGFYEDGSFVQHTDFPYAGGYGGVLMSGISNLLFITDGTPWEVTDPLIENVYDWIINAFEPVYYKGAIMDMVSGRGISRYNSSDHNKGKGLLPKMLALAETAPAPKQTQIKAFVKENVMADSVCETGYFDKMNINDVLAFKELLADDSVPVRGDLTLHKVYGAMDRTVHHRPGYTLGISMHSTRIAAYEVGNGENKKAWHTADGMLYLYNDDLHQYG